MTNDYNPDIVTVIDDDGKEHSFEELDRIETDSGKYIALLPLFDESEKILDNSGELFILKVTIEDDESYLSAIEDEDEFNEIAAIFEDRLADMFEIGEEDGEEESDEEDDIE